MTDLVLKVGGRAYEGWTSIRVTRGIESIAGSFDLSVTDRWADRHEPWPIGEEDEAQVLLGGELVLTGFVDKRRQRYASGEHTFSVSGRDQAGALVDCSAVLKRWEYLGIDLLTLARRIAEPLDIEVTLQPGLVPPALPARLSVDPGESGFEVLDRACRMCGLLPVSDGDGGVLLTRAGTARCTTGLVEGENILVAEADFDASMRHRTYIVTGQHPGSDEFAGDATATIRGTASDPNVRRAERTLMVRSENSITPALAQKRAQWEAKVRAARGETLTIKVEGWTQLDGSIWPVNAKVAVKTPALGVHGDMLISQATYSLDDAGGTVTELRLLRPDAFLPEPVVPQAAWRELAGGVR